MVFVMLLFDDTGKQECERSLLAEALFGRLKDEQR
jgi:hypothetical protein